MVRWRLRFTIFADFSLILVREKSDFYEDISIADKIGWNLELATI